MEKAYDCRTKRYHVYLTTEEISSLLNHTLLVGALPLYSTEEVFAPIRNTIQLSYDPGLTTPHFAVFDYQLAERDCTQHKFYLPKRSIAMLRTRQILRQYEGSFCAKIDPDKEVFFYVERYRNAERFRKSVLLLHQAKNRQ